MSFLRVSFATMGGRVNRRTIWSTSQAGPGRAKQCFEMQRLSCDPVSDVCLQRVAGAVIAGAIVAYPTETYYALGVRAFDLRARRRLLDVKAREASKPLPLIAADCSQAFALFDRIERRVEVLAEYYWPGPLTIVAVVAPSYRSILGETVGVRVSSGLVAAGLARTLGEPVTATSANFSGEPPISDPDVLASRLSETVDLLVDGGRTPGGDASTVVRLLPGEHAQILRLGPISRSDILRRLGPEG